MQRRLFLTGSSAAVLAACASAPGGPVAAPPTLDGTWSPQSATLGGQALPIAAFRGAMLVLRDGRYGFGNDRGRVELLAAPGQMNIRGEEGPNAGKTLLALYERRADELRIAYQLGSGPRPSDFESPAGTQLFVVVYRLQP